MKNTGQNIALHHTAVAGSGKQIHGVNNYHKEKWGMKSTLGWYVAYNYFCEKDGTVIQTRSNDEETIANRGHNCDTQSRCNTISFCMAGDFNKETPTPAQTKAFRGFVHNMQQLHEGIKVVGHRDLQTNRTCPGVNISQQYLDDAIEGFDEDALKADEIAKQMLLITQLKLLVSKLTALLSLKRWV